MRRVSAPGLVGFPTQGQGDDDQVAGGALNQGRAHAGSVLADDQVAFPVARDFPIRNVGALVNQPHSNDGGCADLAGSVPLRQISDHTAAKDLITIQQVLLRATPGRAGGFAGLLGPILPVRTRMAGDLTAHHRGATPNQVGDTHLGQTRIHPRHDRRTIPGTKHPTTPHDQPSNNITATRKLLTPYDTALHWFCF